jgi:hypothetical protein
VKLIKAGILTALIAIGVVSVAKTEATAPPITVASTTTITTTTTTLPPVGYEAQHPECVPYLTLAVSVGWTESKLPTLERVMWKESRCQPHQYFSGDPNGGSHGLTQINGFWCQPSRYHENGYLQHLQLLSSCDDLYDPVVNLRSALAIYEYGDSWSPWGI